VQEQTGFLITLAVYTLEVLLNGTKLFFSLSKPKNGAIYKEGIHLRNKFLAAAIVAVLLAAAFAAAALAENSPVRLVVNGRAIEGDVSHPSWSTGAPWRRCA